MRVLLGTTAFWFALSLVNDAVVNLGLPARLAAVSGSVDPAVLGWLSLSVLAIAAGGQLVAGVLADRWRAKEGRRPLLIAGGLAGAVALLGLGVATDLAQVAIAFGVSLVAFSVAQAPYQALIADEVAGSKRGRASGLKGFADLFGSVAGFVGLGVLFSNSATAALAMPAVAATAVLCLFVVLSAGVGRAESTEPIPHIVVTSPDGPQVRVFRRLVGSRFLFLFGVYAIGRFLFSLAADRFAIPESQVGETAGFLFGGLALVTALASPLAGWLVDRSGGRALALAGALVAAIGAAVLALPSATFLITGGILMALGSAAFGVANWATLSAAVAGDRAASLLAVVNVATVGAAALAGVAGPFMAWANEVVPESGFALLSTIAGAALLLSTVPLWRLPLLAGASPRAVTVSYATRET